MTRILKFITASTGGGPLRAVRIGEALLQPGPENLDVHGRRKRQERRAALARPLQPARRHRRIMAARASTRPSTPYARGSQRSTKRRSPSRSFEIILLTEAKGRGIGPCILSRASFGRDAIGVGWPPIASS